MPYDPEQEPYVALRTKALESLLIEKGLLTAEAVDAARPGRVGGVLRRRGP